MNHGVSVARYGRCGPWLAVLAIAGLTACGDGNGGDKPASQVAAKVNKEELSVHQIKIEQEISHRLSDEILFGKLSKGGQVVIGASDGGLTFAY